VAITSKTLKYFRIFFQNEDKYIKLIKNNIGNLAVKPLRLNLPSKEIAPK
jgi:hypothetical protein